jgi:hypothetical protein
MNYDHQNSNMWGNAAGTEQALCACESGNRCQLESAKDEYIRRKKHLRERLPHQ